MAAIGAIGQVLVLIVTARFVWRYLKETERLRIAAQEQVEATFRPAVVARPGPSVNEPPRLQNIGNGPAIEVEWCLPNSDLKGRIPFLEPHDHPWPIAMDGVKPLFLAAGKSAPSRIECRYRSLSGMQHSSDNTYDLDSGRFSTTFSSTWVSRAS